jgi:(E)-4-hydroxy-3-methylbut-2-enyl-diphosphate synthase
MNNMSLPDYCRSRFQAVRRQSSVVQVGDIPVGGANRIAIQSMVTTPTQDITATVQQSIALAEAGCDIVRITAQNVKAAEALGSIRKEFTAAGFGNIPLVADIHFLPQAAMEAARHVEKVRINPGNYADKKKFQVKEYSESEYKEELDRLHEAFSPIVLRCKELGRAMRIGTNHGSLSDRIMNRYGDSPLGMCESALEFIRIAESHGYHDIILSMKASNPKVMIQAYRLIVAKMALEDMHYPLHLGVTEAGDGDDARIKSAIGIGSLLYDGLGDTIRVSLTEDPVEEIPVAQALARKAEALWMESAPETLPDDVDPYEYTRRPVDNGVVGDSLKLGNLEPPLVIQPGPPVDVVPTPADYHAALAGAQSELGDARIEGLLLPVTDGVLNNPAEWRESVDNVVNMVVWDTSGQTFEEREYSQLKQATHKGDLWLAEFSSRPAWGQFCEQAEQCGARSVLANL